jgi:hypothetical protein
MGTVHAPAFLGAPSRAAVSHQTEHKKVAWALPVKEEAAGRLNQPWSHRAVRGVFQSLVWQWNKLRVDVVCEVFRTYRVNIEVH